METGVEAVYEEYDLYHMVLGDIRPGAIRDHTKGSHISIPELQGKMFQIGEIKHLQNGYFDMYIERGSNSKLKTYFPRGTSVEKAVDIVEDAIKNAKEIKSISKNGNIAYRITSQSGDVFRIDITDKVARPYPINPKSIIE